MLFYPQFFLNVLKIRRQMNDEILLIVSLRRMPGASTCALTQSAIPLARLAVHESDLRLSSTATWRPQRRLRGQGARERPLQGDPPDSHHSQLAAEATILLLSLTSGASPLLTAGFVLTAARQLSECHVASCYSCCCVSASLSIIMSQLRSHTSAASAPASSSSFSSADLLQLIARSRLPTSGAQRPPQRLPTPRPSQIILGTLCFFSRVVAVQ